MGAWTAARPETRTTEQWRSECSECQFGLKRHTLAQPWNAARPQWPTDFTAGLRRDGGASEARRICLLARFVIVVAAAVAVLNAGRWVAAEEGEGEGKEEAEEVEEDKRRAHTGRLSADEMELGLGSVALWDGYSGG